MPAVVGIVTLVALIGFYVTTGTPSPTQVEPPIKAEAGIVAPHRTEFNYRAPTPTETVQAVPPAVIAPVKTVVHATVQIQAPPAVVTPPAPVVPKQEPAITACLGVFVGTACTYTGATGTVSGTCTTPAFSPMTCIAH
jgi:hypothetical protein